MLLSVCCGAAAAHSGLISTSEIKISVLIDKKDTKKALDVLHNEFELNK